MDERFTAQLQLDFRTGRPTAIAGPFITGGERAACSALNTQRARGILQISQLSPSRESLSPDVWATIFIRKTREWDVPLIPLFKLGLEEDEDGFLSSLSPKQFQPLRSGAEVFPFADYEAGVVYKLFYLLENGALGKKVSYELNESGRFEVQLQDAILADTLAKIITLHDAGAHPTEIVGLSDSGGYLIVKQPLANAHLDFEKDQTNAIEAICGVPLSCQGIRGRAIVTWVNNQGWLVSDLHPGNIMRDAENNPTIIDALTGPIPPLAWKQLSALRHTIEDAKNLRQGQTLRIRPKFDDVEDADL